MTQPDDFGSGFFLIALEFQITVMDFYRNRIVKRKFLLTCLQSGFPMYACKEIKKRNMLIYDLIHVHLMSSLNFKKKFKFLLIVLKFVCVSLKMELNNTRCI